MQKTVVINIVGLTASLIGEHTPHIKAFRDAGNTAFITPQIPAVTTTAQSTYLTGVGADQHGIVANGWYFKDECEVKFWRQSNKLVTARKIWEHARESDPSFTVANMFWWYNMYSTADYIVTPRPMYPATGLKLPDVYSYPENLRSDLQQELGQFPLFEFWGPNASIRSTQWIANATKSVEKRHNPTLTLVYLPHMDYSLQKFGPDVAKVANDLREVDAMVGDLIAFYRGRNPQTQIILLSEYGITHVNRPIHINRVLRENGLIAVREELGLELMDAGVSKAFAASDHQIAHVYVNDPSVKERVRELLNTIPGIATILDERTKADYHLDHPRSGDFVALAEPNAWFTYYYWLDDAKAPDFARTVDIHRKPGYDPAELFINPDIRFPMLHVGRRVLQKKLGFRYLMDVIGLDATLVKGSHGVATAKEAGPLLITQSDVAPQIQATDVYGVIWRALMPEKTAAVPAPQKHAIS
jgi:predicted AlkP superfamily pyrophosphatase or phosphodiesterase